MRVIIVEDEGLVAERLASLLLRVNPAIEILAILDSVQETLDWITNHDLPDLGFFDIQLADGLSFDVFERADISFPVIFTTAFDAYALRAFKVNSIDYLLKPVDEADLKSSLEKYQQMYQAFSAAGQQTEITAVRQLIDDLQRRKEYKSRFIVKAGEHLSSVPAEDVAFFYSEHKTVWLKRHSNGHKHAIDYTLEQLEGMLDPNRFFRLNRKYFTSIQAIGDVISFSNSRLRIFLKGAPADNQILISREKVSAFKAWLDQ